MRSGEALRAAPFNLLREKGLKTNAGAKRSTGALGGE